jgi:hypothetical protein
MAAFSDDPVFEQRLLALAVLKAHWDSQQQGYIDMFVPFAMEAAHQSGVNPIPIPELRQATSHQLGFALPDAALRTVIQRAVARGLGEPVQGHVWAYDEQAVAAFDSTHLRAELQREQRALLHALRDYAQGKFGVDLSQEDAEAAIAGIISAAGSEVLLRATGYAVEVRAEAHFVAASFIEHVLSEEPEHAAYLERVVVGSMLAAAAREPGLDGGVANPFREVTVFLDTPIVLDLLGRTGDAQRESAMESVKLLVRAGARVACFDHTIGEAQSVFHGLADSIQQGFRRGSPPAYGTLEEYVIQKKLKSSDLIVMAENVEHNLRRLGIVRITPPPHSAGLVTIDEVEAEQTVIAEVHPERKDPKAAARYDLDSMTATYRVRGGNVTSLEDCRAVFVARNRAFVRAARKIYPPSVVGAPIAMHSTDIVTLAWLKCPSDIPNLPRLRLAADAYAAARPSRVLVEKYTEVLIQLRDRQQISENDLYEMRYATEAHTILMAKTYGDEDRLDEPTVIDIIESTRQLVQETADATARTELRSVEAELNETRASEQRLASTSTRQQEELESAHTTIRVLRTAIGALVAVVTVGVCVPLWYWLDGPIAHTGLVMGAVLMLTFAVAIALSRARAVAALGAIGLLLGIGSVVYQLVSATDSKPAPKPPPHKKKP